MLVVMVNGVSLQLEGLRLPAPIEQRRGLLVNTILEVVGRNATEPERIKHHLGVIEGSFRQALESARRHRELAADKDPAARAASMMSRLGNADSGQDGQ
jgi:hypothetical protein